MNPPILREPRLSAFINEVFGNLAEIVTYHQRLLAALFARQREQHPLIQSVADIFLDSKSPFYVFACYLLFKYLQLLSNPTSVLHMRYTSSDTPLQSHIIESNSNRIMHTRYSSNLPLKTTESGSAT